jgi:hypothetical protein
MNHEGSRVGEKVRVPRLLEVGNMCGNVDVGDWDRDDSGWFTSETIAQNTMIITGTRQQARESAVSRAVITTRNHSAGHIEEPRCRLMSSKGPGYLPIN